MVIFLLVDEDLLYQLIQCRRGHIQLCLIWNEALSTLPSDGSLRAWGPSNIDLEQGRMEWNMDIIDSFRQEEDEYSEEDIDENDLDVGLIERMDALEIDLMEADEELW
jgi:hypothetical protein